MKTKETQTSDLATPTGLRPGDFPIGSPHSRAAARNLAENRGIRAMQDWVTVHIEDLERAKAFAKKLRNADSTNPIKVRLLVRTHKTHQHAEDARNRKSSGKISLTVDDEERALRLASLLADRHGGVVIYVDVVVNDKG